jgi:hypothetical protein
MYWRVATWVPGGKVLAFYDILLKISQWSIASKEGS